MKEKPITFPPISELRRLCRLITRNVRATSLAGHRLLIHEVRPHFVTPGHTVREHEHSYYEAHILLGGSALYTMGTPQLMTPGGALLHGPHTPHAWQEPEVPCLRLLIWFSMEPSIIIPRPPQWPIWPDILWDVDLLLRDARSRAPGWPHRVSARLSVVLSRLLSIANWPNSPQESELPEMSLIPEIDHFLRDNIARPLNLQDIADHVGFSQRTLCRHFLTLTGSTVMERLMNLRMERATTLLAETELGIGEIGTQVGMPDPSYFCRRFRIHAHITPQAYRKQIRTKEENKR